MKVQWKFTSVLVNKVKLVKEVNEGFVLVDVVMVIEVIIKR